MSYAPLDDCFDDCPKYAERTAAEMGCIACAITNANRNLSDGRIARVWPERRFGREGVKLAKRMIELGIWVVRPDGDYEIVGYLEHNSSKAEVLERRAKRAIAGQAGGKASGQSRAAPRAQAKAEANASPEGSKPSSKLEAPVEPTSLHFTQITEGSPQPPEGAGGDPSIGLEPKPSDEPPPRLVGDGGDVSSVDRLGVFGMEGEWWREGVSRATGKPCSAPKRFELRDLSQGLREQFGKLPIDRLEQAIRESAELYARGLKANQGVFVRAYLGWLNAGNYTPPRIPGPEIVKAVDPNAPPAERYVSASEADEQAEKIMAMLKGVGRGPRRAQAAGAKDA